MNEIQFDIKHVPNRNFTSQGQNLKKLAKRLEVNFKHSIFSQANTGNLAIKNRKNEYVTSFSVKDARRIADPVNFGIFPGQYSTGALSNLRIVKARVIKKLRWKEFNPDIDLSKYRLANGKNVPENIQLFDKSFMDILIESDSDQRFHLILLHAVPAYDFGNKRSINYIRNGDQLRFLEWYLTGKTDLSVPMLREDGQQIVSLPPGSRFVAVGDWNTSIKNPKNPGTWVLKRLFKATKPWIKIKDMSFTNESIGYHSNLKLMLDYIVTDKETKVIDGKIFHPNYETKGLDCQEHISEDQKIKLKSQRETKMKYVLYDQWIPKKKKIMKCHALVHESYFEYKNASDHYPLYLEFKL